MTTVTGLSQASIDHLEANGIEIRFRIKNHAVDYSIMNKPSASDTGLTDDKLATCIVIAGKTFAAKHASKIPLKNRESVVRSDGRTLVYDEIITIDWTKGEIASTRGHDMTLSILSIVVQDLVTAAQRGQKKQPMN
jgi:hypothetical protein